MTLIELIKSELPEEDKKIASNIDFEKTDGEIIASMTTARLLNFDSTKHDDQETR